VEDKGPRVMTYIKAPNPNPLPVSPYISVSEDIEWLRDVWVTRGADLSFADLRRGSATLRKLLVNGLINEAWHAHGIAGAPKIVGPDLLAAIALQNHEVRHGASVIAGGAVRSGVITCAFGVWQVAHPVTGVGPDAESGFAVCIQQMSRIASDTAQPNELLAIAEKTWKLGAYLEAPGAIRRGEIIPRSTIIEYFANYAGGVHLDKVKTRSPKKHALFRLVEELEKSLETHDLNSPYFELLSIGQAIGRSKDLNNLAAVIRTNAKGLK
jgi:hypothetical protein